MEFNEFKSHSKSKSKRWVGLSLVALVAIGGVVYYTWPREVAGEDTPPVLEMSTSALQGAFIDDKIKFYNYEQKDVDKWEKENGGTELNDKCDKPKDLEPGIHFYTVKSEKTVLELKSFIKPEKDNKILIAYYDNLEKKFFTFPGGPFSETELFPEDYRIPANKGIVIISEKPSNIYCVRTETEVAKVAVKPLKNNEEGWALIQTTDDPQTAFASFKDRLELNSEGKPQVWVLTDEREFQIIDSLEKLNSTVPKYKMIWVKVKEKDSASKPS